MKYSIVVPIKDEEENIELLVQEIEEVMQPLRKPWELLFIDDGSQDRSREILRTLSARPSSYPFRFFSFTHNCGQSAAFGWGFEQARGEFVISLDGDRQNDPRDIPTLIAAIENAEKKTGLVVGWRKTRRDCLQKRLISSLSNWVRSRLCQDGVHDTGCSLKIYRRSALKQIKMYKGMHRFLPALFQIEGWHVHEVAVNHRPRVKGKTKYAFWNRSLGPIVDMFVVFWMRRRTVIPQIQESSDPFQEKS